MHPFAWDAAGPQRNEKVGYCKIVMGGDMIDGVLDISKIYSRIGTRGRKVRDSEYCGRRCKGG